MTDQPPVTKPPLTPLRWFFAITGGLLALFAGGCSILFITVLLSFSTYTPGGPSADWNLEDLEDAVAIVGPYGAPSILAGLLILWLALKLSRGGHGDRHNGEEESND